MIEPSFRPAHPEARDQGDPYVLAAPPEAGTRYRYYVYVTGVVAREGRAFPVYGSHDLVRWSPLGAALVADPSRDYWAPCVRYIPGLERPFVMLYSRALGRGEQAHIGHMIRRADSTTPEGPFVDSGHLLTADLDFAIDPDVYRAPDGRLRLAFATDFVDDPPLGTGIVEAPIDETLASLVGPITPLARAQYAWQIYDAQRKMPWKYIPGVDWKTDTVVWHTLEGPVGGLVSPQGREVYLYSGGCFFAYYAIGALVREPSGELRDVSGPDGHIVLQPQPERGFFSPGHCSWFRDAHGTDYLMFHARFGRPNAPRQMCLARLGWNANDLPYVEPTALAAG